MSITDAGEEGIWRDVETGEQLDYQIPWANFGKYKEPSGGVIKNVAYGKWTLNKNTFEIFSDNGTSDSPFVACEHPVRPYLRLRGLCEDSALDSLYLPLVVQDTPPIEYPWNQFTDISTIYVGESGGLIFYNQISWEWEIVKKYGWHKTFTIDSNIQNVIGKFEWSTMSSTEACNIKDKNTHYYSYVDLKLTGCHDDQFTCASGDCIPMMELCNQINNCGDESDEKNCTLLDLNEGYDKNLAPVTIRNYAKEHVPVLISITLLQIVDIDEVRKTRMGNLFARPFCAYVKAWLPILTLATLNFVVKLFFHRLWLPLLMSCGLPDRL